MLLGREEERLALDRLLADARTGHSGVLAFVGEPGIGKTALVDYAAEHAAGMRVLRARGIESEAEVPFGGLLELLRPALTALDRIPAPQAEALAGALALRPAHAQDRFAVGAATLSLLAAHAEEAPVLLAVDDAHWLDASTAEALLFAIRRLVAETIAVVLSVRDGQRSLLDGADLRVVRVGGLDRRSAAALLVSAAMPREAVDRLYDATGGNPLALLELARDPPVVASLPPGAPLPVSKTIAQSFLRRVSALDADTRRIVLLAAASDTGDVALLGRAASSLGLDLEALVPAEAAGLVRLGDGELEFRHPLARSAVYAGASDQARREVHDALARTLPDRDIDRRAWHLAAAAIGLDETASTALEQAGSRARVRSAYAVAAAAFERGGRLTTSEARRAQLLFAAADCAWLGGLADRAMALLDEARSHAADPGLAGRIEHLRAHVTTRRGPIGEGVALLMAAADLVAEREPGLAVVMLAEAAHACVYAGDTGTMLEAARRASSLASDGADARTEFFAAVARGMALITAGEGEEGAGALRRAVELAQNSAELRDDLRLLALTTQVPLWLREAQAGRELIARAVALARQHSAAGVLPYILNHVGRDESMTDRWAEAESTFHEAIQLARETGQRSELAVGLASLAWLEARQGKGHECRAHAGEARAVCREVGIAIYDIWAIAAVGELELAAGRPADALEQFEAQALALESVGFADVDIAPGPELVECYLRLGRREEAVVATAEYAAKAERKGQPWALARAARSRALVAAEGEFQQPFDDALALHEQTPDVFELARTRLAYGARLRRTRQRVRAREELRRAVELFDGLGAAVWAELAIDELAATGETARRRDASTLDQLTPRERQIALLLAGGSTTREAAAGLFLSPKTVEYHLRHVYRKLGIRSREELALALGT
jgi:DNA-binding CsgD family transcriptional regulator